MHIKNFVHSQLSIDSLQTNQGDSWCFFGKNGSGIEVFLQFLEGRLDDFSTEEFIHDPRAGILSFHGIQELFEEELRNDDTDFMDRIDPGTTAARFLGDISASIELLRGFNMEKCLTTGIRQLSSGQCRKLILLKEVIRGTQTIILQNPFDGLDPASCNELNATLATLEQKGITILLLVSSRGDIPPWCSHLGYFKNGRLQANGPREIVIPTINKERLSDSQDKKQAPLQRQERDNKQETPEQEELIRLRNGFAAYGETRLFEGLDLDIRRGDHTLIYGRNGCGKSTLLDIFTGDNSKCYANDLRIFGQPRGGGESIWQIKEQMGIISPGLHRDHRVPGSALHVVLSGLFDTIGLYDKVSSVEVKQGRRWLDWIGLHTVEDRPFRHLDFASQRLVLIARALIKTPRLLIFDEATQGLDDANRQKFLDLLEQIANQELSTILFVSHRTDEYRSFFKQKIKLDDYSVDPGVVGAG